MATQLANAHVGEWAFYGATGVTGRIILERALARGHRPTLIGRDPGRLNQLAKPNSLGTVRADLDDSTALADAVAGRKLVLNST
jgi:putative NADH-flavin reductase